MFELMKQLDALWDKAYDKCNRFYEEYERGYEELENEPFDCELSSARIRRIEGGDGVAIDYSAAHIYDACVSHRCGPYDEEEVDVERAYARCREACLEDAESYAKSVIDEYRRAVERWAKRRGVAYAEELKRDELNFTLIIRLHPAAVGP
jgi:hypothetical protein